MLPIDTFIISCQTTMCIVFMIVCYENGFVTLHGLYYLSINRQRNILRYGFCKAVSVCGGLVPQSVVYAP